MTKLMKLAPNERLLIESGINHYKVVGPGLIWLKPWQRSRAKLYIGPTAMTVECNQARAAGDILVNGTIKVIYRINPELFSEALLPRIPGLNDGGWRNIVQWRTEAVVYRLVARYRWRELKQPYLQEQLEEQIGEALGERLKGLGLDVLGITLIKTALNDKLQRTIIRAEQDKIEARGRAAVLKQYFEIFGDSLSGAMPHIIQWELLNTLHKNGNSHLLLGASNLSLGSSLPNVEPAPSLFQMRLPVPSNGEQG